MLEGDLLEKKSGTSGDDNGNDNGDDKRQHLPEDRRFRYLESSSETKMIEVRVA